MIAIDLSEQQALDADSKAIQQINSKSKSNKNLNWGQIVNGNTTMFFITEETKEIIFDLK